MGKSSKKSNVGEVPPAGVTVPPVKSAKKGKRGSEQPTAKSANTKKQKVEVVGQGRKKSKKPQVLEKKKPETNSSEDITSSDSEEEIVKKVSIHAKKLPPTPSKNGTTAAVSKEGQPQSNSESDSDSKDVALKNASQDMSSDDDEDKSSDELPQAQRDELKRESDESNSSEEDSSEGSDDESENEQTMNSPKKKATSDATGIKSAARSEKKELQTPAVSQNQKSGSKTLFVGNLSYDVGEDDVKEFFKEAGEIVDVRFSQDADGRFRGFGHVEFVDVEGAQKAIELNGQELSGRAVKLDFAREKGAYTPNNGKDDNSHQKSGKGQSQTIFVRGFDKSVEMDEIEGSLKEYFGSCGEITRVSLPRDYETGGSKGIAYLDFKEEDGFSKALELNGSELGESTLTVEEAKPKGAGSGGGGGGGGGRGGRGGRRGGFGGGRGGGRSGFGGGRGGRGSGRGGGRGRKW